MKEQPSPAPVIPTWEEANAKYMADIPMTALEKFVWHHEDNDTRSMDVRGSWRWSLREVLRESTRADRAEVRELVARWLARSERLEAKKSSFDYGKSCEAEKCASELAALLGPQEQEEGSNDRSRGAVGSIE